MIIGQIMFILYMMVAGVLLLCGAVCVGFIKDKKN